MNLLFLVLSLIILAVIVWVFWELKIIPIPFGLAIRDKGGNCVGIGKLPSTFALQASYTSKTDCYKIPNVSDESADTSLSTEKFKSSDKLVRFSESSREIDSNYTVMDSDKDTMDFLAFTINDFEYAIEYRYNGIVGTKYQEQYAIVQPHGQYNSKAPGGATAGKYTATFVTPGAAVTWTSGALTILFTALSITRKGTGNITIAANHEFALDDTAVT